MKILYVCDFDLKKGQGKNRATFQKLKSLRGKVSELTVVSGSNSTILYRFFSLLILEIKGIILLFLKKPDLVISRGNVGLVIQAFAKLLGVRTAREIHSYAYEELSLLPYRGFKLAALRALAKISHAIDLGAEQRIFNHPDLLRWYKEKGLNGEHDFYSYNGFDPACRNDITKSQARKEFGFHEDEKILAFIGSASKWHGIDYLVSLQKEFLLAGDEIKVVVAGGNIQEYDPAGLCLNISPLDEEGCAKLIRAADFCLLPVRSNRISPGSPLKLYDYIGNRRFVLAQSNTNGYSDEVLKYNIGVPVDFTCSKSARADVLNAFEASWPATYPDCPVSWADRMDEWLSSLVIK